MAYFKSVSTVTHGSNAISKVVSIGVSESAQELIAPADGAVGRIGLATTGDAGPTRATVNFNDFASFNLSVLGAKATLSWTSVEAEGGTNLTCTLTNAVVAARNHNEGHGRIADFSVTFISKDALSVA